MPRSYLTLVLQTAFFTFITAFAYWARAENAVAEMEDDILVAVESGTILPPGQLEIRPALSILTPDGDTDFNQLISHVGHLLQKEHYSRMDLDEAACEKVLESYFVVLDPEKVFFHQGHLEKFRQKYLASLHKLIFERGVEVASDMFRFHRDLVKARVDANTAILERGSLTARTGDTVALDRANLPFEKDDAALDELWRKRLLNDVINERVYAARQTPGHEAAKSEERKVAEFYQRYYNRLECAGEEEMAAKFLSAMCHSFDPHSEYLGVQEKEKFDNDMKKKLVGIGVRFAKDEARAIIDSLIPGGPAQKSGLLKEGDRIMAISQSPHGPMENVEKMQTDQIADKIRGEESTDVQLEVESTKAKEVRRVITLKRATVDLKESRARAELIEFPASQGGQKIGWLTIDNFYGDPELHSLSVTADVKVLLERLQAESIDALVVDLRDNPGGYLDEAVSLAGLFLPRGPVVLEKDNKGRVVPKVSKQWDAQYEGPLVVMTDGGSASASEIFAAALQDRGRAVLVGEGTTYGKGTVQAVLNMGALLPKGVERERVGTLKLTIRKFYRVAGGSTQVKGVEPDIVLPRRSLRHEGGEKALSGALPYDNINPVKYPLAPNAPLPLTELQIRSKARVAADGDLQALKSDVASLGAEKQANTLTLDEKQRLAQQADYLNLLTQRRASRKAKFDADEASHQLLKLTNLNLQNATEAKLQPRPAIFPVFANKPGNGRVLESPDDFPLGLEPNKRETLAVARDLIHLLGKKPEKETAERTVEIPASIR